MKKSLFFMLFACATFYSVHTAAQLHHLSQVQKFYLHNINAITTNNEVVGYYTFYLIDRVDKNNSTYSLTILDENLRQTHSIGMTKSKNLFLLESGFNGERFCFVFLDRKAKSLEYELLDKGGKSVGKYTVKGLSNREMAVINQAVNTESNLSGGLISVPGKGFVRYGADKNKGMRIEMEFFDNNGKKKWTSGSISRNVKAYERAIPIFSNEQIVASMVTSSPSMLSIKNMETFIIFHDADNGKELHRMASTNKFQLWPNGVSYNERAGEIYIYGEYYNPKDNVVKTKSQGLFFQSLDKNWNENNMKFISWTKDIGPTITRNRKGKLDPKMNITIHSMVGTYDGKFFAIGEQYKKAVDAGGVALRTVGTAAGVKTDASYFKIELHDMIVFEFDNSFSLLDVHFVEKPKTNINLPREWSMLAPSTLAFMMKHYGWFDYVFTTMAPDQKEFTSAFVNYGKEKGEKRKLLIGNIAYNKDQEVVNDNLTFDRSPTTVKLFPAKPGYIAIFEYYQREKKIEMRLEKLNI